MLKTAGLVLRLIIWIEISSLWKISPKISSFCMFLDIYHYPHYVHFLALISLSLFFFVIFDVRCFWFFQICYVLEICRKNQKGLSRFWESSVLFLFFMYIIIFSPTVIVIALNSREWQRKMPLLLFLLVEKIMRVPLDEPIDLISGLSPNIYFFFFHFFLMGCVSCEGLFLWSGWGGLLKGPTIKIFAWWGWMQTKTCVFTLSA